MTRFCDDRDLLGIDPEVFLQPGPPAQVPLAGTGGVLTGTAFTAPTDFTAAGVEPGRVLCTYTDSPGEASAWEIVSVDADDALTVSVLRADAGDPPIAPPAGTELGFEVRSFAAQVAAASNALAETLRRAAETAGIELAEFVDSAQLRTAAAVGALAAVHAARARTTGPSDGHWAKATHFLRELSTLERRLRLAVDLDGDGVAERTRSLGNVTLRRI